MKQQIARQIVATLHERHLTARAAAVAAGNDAADIHRIRNGDLARFTFGRRIRIVGRLGYQVELAIPKPHAPL